MNYEGLSDKRAYLQVLGCLMKDVTLLDDLDLPLDKADFDTGRFYTIIFVAIYNLYVNGCEVINEFSIDSYLEKHEEQHKVFEENNGLQYLSDARDMADLKSYTYYYHIVRKYSLLRYYEKLGLDTRFIFDSTKTDAREIDEENAKFEELTESQIVEMVESRFVIEPNMKYCTNTNVTEVQAGKGIFELIEQLQESPDIGLPLINPALTTITRGMRMGCLFMESSPQGTGKSRRQVGNACRTAIPYYYDKKKKKFVHTSICEPVLYISTEMTYDQIQTMLLAFVSGVNEDSVLWNKYEKGELERVKKAAKYIEESPLYIIHISDFDYSDIQNLIKKYVREHNVRYVFFDYIQSTIRMMSSIASQSKVSGLKEFQLLLIFSTQLKSLAEELGIFIYTSSQLSGEAKEATIFDQNLLAGSKALANKLDVGIITIKADARHLKKVESITKKMINKPMPNFFSSVYKVRRGKLTRLLVWSYTDLGTMEETPLFVTDFDYVQIDVDFTKVETVEDIINDNSVLESHVKDEPIMIETDDETVNEIVETSQDSKQDNIQDEKSKMKWDW